MFLNKVLLKEKSYDYIWIYTFPYSLIELSGGEILIEKQIYLMVFSTFSGKAHQQVQMYKQLDMSAYRKYGSCLVV